MVPGILCLPAQRQAEASVLAHRPETQEEVLLAGQLVQAQPLESLDRELLESPQRLFLPHLARRFPLFAAQQQQHQGAYALL